MTVRVAGFGRHKLISSSMVTFGSEVSSTLVKSKEVREIHGIYMPVKNQ